MANMDLFMLVYIFVGILALILNLLGLFLLVTHKRKSISHLCLIHLCIVEVIFYTFDISYKTRCVMLFNWTSNRDDFYWKKPWTLVLSVAQYLSVMLLTTDRVLAVRLGLKYKFVMTRKKFLLALVVTWVLCLLHYPYYFLTRRHTIYLFWYSALGAFITISYIYIIANVKISVKNSQGAATFPGQKRVKYEVPFLITLTIACLYFIPEVLIELGIYTIWYNVVWALNFLCDPLIYIFGSLAIRKRLKQCWSGETRRSRASTIDAATLRRLSLSMANKPKAQKVSTATLASRLSVSSLPHI